MASKIVPVLAGGGSRLTAHIGVLAAIESMEIRFDDLVGVSGGSIVGALYAAGYQLPEIKQIALETDFSQFFGQSVWTLLRTGGLSTGEKFTEWMDEKLKGLTFEKLPMNFHVVTTDVKTGLPVIFNKKTTPNLTVALAVRYSMSIPLLFSFREYRHHLLVDGSILSEDALQRDWSGDGTPILVFRLRSVQSAEPVSSTSMFPLKTYLSLLIRTFMTTMSREYINDSFWHSTVVIDTGTISPVQFHLDPKQKEVLYQAGFETAKRIIPMKLVRLAPQALSF